MEKQKSILLLENGYSQIGQALGATGDTIGELVFNTSMTGYEEILTDPSYAGQVVCMTYPLIGNYGINLDDAESTKVHAKGLVIKENSKIYSNFTAKSSLDEYLKQNKITAIEGIDTRAITKILRDEGAMKVIISSTDFDIKSLKQKLKQAPNISDQDLVGEVGTKEVYEYKSKQTSSFCHPERNEVKSKDPLTKIEVISPFRSASVEMTKIVVIDCGVKKSILDNLANQFKKVIVVPATSKVQEILDLSPDAILFSNGPGDPEQEQHVLSVAKELIQKLEKKEITIPLFGICLGCQILGMALGGKKYKLKFGHHGGNHPVKDLQTGKVDITAQNHNYCINLDGVKDLEMTHLNLYDNTTEGLRHKKLPIFAVQFHPEAGPGPFDAKYIFERFRS